MYLVFTDKMPISLLIIHLLWFSNELDYLKISWYMSYFTYSNSKNYDILIWLKKTSIDLKLEILEKIIKAEYKNHLGD